MVTLFAATLFACLFLFMISANIAMKNFQLIFMNISDYNDEIDILNTNPFLCPFLNEPPFFFP